MMKDDDKTHKKEQTGESSPKEPAKSDTNVTPGPAPASDTDSDADDSLDFGGLPARNLKKNLGCGG